MQSPKTWRPGEAALDPNDLGSRAWRHWGPLVRQQFGLDLEWHRLARNPSWWKAPMSSGAS